jgi:hypothetical protein
MKLGIDVYTKDKKYIMRRLARLRATMYVCDGGMYMEDRNYSQIHLDTAWTEAELDAWLYRQKGIDYVGTFERKED